MDENVNADILEQVVTSGDLMRNMSSAQMADPDEVRHALEVCVEFEAQERGLESDKIAEAIAYALRHYQIAA